jgi:nitrogen fixation protein FixH
MKINWGTGIFIFYVCFASLLVFQVYKSTTYDHFLVADNYYEKDLAYQSLFDKKQNSLNLDNPLKIEYNSTEEQLVLHFPNQMKSVSGNILFYRADDKNQDLKFVINMNDDNKMMIPTASLKNGYWNVEVDWVAMNTPFFDEKEIKF